LPRRKQGSDDDAYVWCANLTMPDPLRSGLSAATSRSLLAEITGKTAVEWGEACGTVLGEPSVSPALLARAGLSGRGRG
jgi:hypothetical protein